MNLIPYEKNEKVRIVFLFQVASFWPSWESFYNACICDKRFDVKLVLINEILSEPGLKNKAKKFVESKGLSYLELNEFCFKEYKPHIIVYQTPYEGNREMKLWSARMKYLGIRVIYFPYGIEIADTESARRDHFLTPMILNSYRIYTLSETMIEEYKKFCPNSKAVRALGLPRFDALFNKQNYPLPKDIKDKAAGRKIVLWKAHFPKTIIENNKIVQVTPDIEEYLAFSKEISHFKDLFFIFLPHPKFCDETIQEELRCKAKKLLEELEKLDNVYIDFADDYRPSLVNADAIIIDRSAVMIEAGALNIPILYMYNPNFNEPMTKAVAQLVEAYDQGINCNDMVAFLERFRNGVDNKRRERESGFKKCVPYFDGKSSERIKEEIIESLQKEDITYNRKIYNLTDKIEKIIFFGTGKVCNFILKYMNEIEKKYEVVAFVDNNETKWGTQINGIPIISPHDIMKHNFDLIVISTDYKLYDEIFNQLTNSYGIAQNRIVPYDYLPTLLYDL